MAPSDSLLDVTSSRQVEDLAERILMPRLVPLVLVSTDASGRFAFDIDRLRGELSGIADVVSIETGPATHELEPLLPPKTHAFGGAARSYPPDFGADPLWTRSKLRFPRYDDTDALIADVMSQIGRRRVESKAPTTPRSVTGVVRSFLTDSRALVQLDDGTILTATSALLAPDIPLDWALTIGAPVVGDLDDDAHELHLRPRLPDLRADLPEGVTTLAAVAKVTERRATLLLHPHVPVILRRRDVTPDEDQPVDDVLRVGDVVAVRVRHETSGPALSVVDADPGERHPALPIIDGGGPWLTPGRRVSGLGADPLGAGRLRTGPPGAGPLGTSADAERGIPQATRELIASTTAATTAARDALPGARGEGAGTRRAHARGEGPQSRHARPDQPGGPSGRRGTCE